MRIKEGIEVRTHLKMMICIHFMMLMLELFFFNLIVNMLACEMFYLWLSYNCYMTLHKWALISYIICIALSFACVFRVYEVGQANCIILYCCQLGLYAYFGVFQTCVKTRAYLQSQSKSELLRQQINQKMFTQIDFATRPTCCATYEGFLKETNVNPAESAFQPQNEYEEMSPDCNNWSPEIK